MNILDEIVAFKKEEVAASLGHITESDLLSNSYDQRTPLDFHGALKQKGLSIIAEVKKASPSKGLIRPNFNPVEIAISYERSGANCISVLTERKYFQGHNDFLIAIRKAVNIPIIRKDFIVDPRQIRESFDLGADAILLITSVLSSDELSEYLDIAAGFGLHCLVETHTEEEIERAVRAKSQIIGVNNRDLKTFKTDIHHSIEVKKFIPDSVVAISESGIYDSIDCSLLYNSGFDAILVGETLMRQENPGAYIGVLIGECRE